MDTAAAMQDCSNDQASLAVVELQVFSHCREALAQHREVFHGRDVDRDRDESDVI